MTCGVSCRCNPHTLGYGRSPLWGFKWYLQGKIRIRASWGLGLKVTLDRAYWGIISTPD